MPRRNTEASLGAMAGDAGGASWPAAFVLRVLAGTLALVCWPLWVAAAADPWRIVVLAGVDLAQPAAVQQERGFRGAVGAAAPNGVQFYSEFVDSQRFQQVDVTPELLALLTKKYRQHPVDLVVAYGDFALEFAERYHEELWPGKPVLIYSMEERRLRTRGLPADFSYVPLQIDVDGTLAIAEALQPKAQRLVVVAGSGTLDRIWGERAVEAARRRTSHHWVPEIWSGVPLPELRERLASLDRNAAVVYPMMFRDRDGRSYFPYEVVGPMAEVSHAPIYGWYPNYLERGLTAGSLLNHEENGRRAGQLAVSILRGERPAAGANLPAPASQCTANVERMQALGLDVSALPAGCALANVPPSLWHDYKREMIGVLAVLILQAITITALLVQRRRRRFAEDEAARRRVELNRAARVAALGELSASIAHEVGQPLGAIVTNTEAAELMLDSGQPSSSELQEIFSDVRRDALRAHEVVRRLRALLEKHSVDFAPLDLAAAFEEALALLTPEARRRGILLERRFAAGAGSVLGDRIQMQQVLLNLVLNAMDAMQATPERDRVVSVSLRSAEDGFELEVADRGHGLPAGAEARLFESFFTTKEHGVGLGLSIVRTLVNAHGGRIRAAAREGGGSVFAVWLPRARVEGARQGALVDAG